MPDRNIVAQFHKSAGGRLSLWSMTVVEEKTAGDGRKYLARTYYDVDYSRTQGYIFHMSGGGGGNDPVPVDSIYFVSGHASVSEQPCTLCERSATTGRWRTREIRARNKPRRLRALPKAFSLAEGQDLLGWMENNAIQSKSVYCSECRDSFSERSFNHAPHSETRSRRPLHLQLLRRRRRHPPLGWRS